MVCLCAGGQKRVVCLAAERDDPGWSEALNLPCSCLLPRAPEFARASRFVFPCSERQDVQERRLVGLSLRCTKHCLDHSPYVVGRLT